MPDRPSLSQVSVCLTVVMRLAISLHVLVWLRERIKHVFSFAEWKYVYMVLSQLMISKTTVCKAIREVSSRRT